MPKVSSSIGKKLNDFVKEFGSDVFSTDGSVLFCKVCEKSVNFEKKYFISQHVQTAKHQNAANKTKPGDQQTSLLTTFSASTSRKSTFSLELCKAFVDAGIPLWKLENKSLKLFLEKYTKQVIPSESTLRKNYVDTLYDLTMQRIKEEVKDKKIWISIDETTDVKGRYVANVIIGTLEVAEMSKIYLLTSEELEKTNSSTIAQLFTTALALLWPEGVQHKNVLLFLSDAAPYMKKSARVLKVLFPEMIHLTCLAHGLHRIAEHVRGLFPSIDKLVSNGKKIFLKAPSRCVAFKEIAPELALPPQPILTRWGTWISAVLYYTSNLDKFEEVIESLDDSDSSAVHIVKELLQDKVLRNDLAFIASNYAKLPEAINALEKRNMPLVDALKCFESIIEDLSTVSGKKGKSVHQKCEQVVAANKDLEKMKNIRRILEGENDADVGDMDPQTVACFKYAPVTSVDVERSFSLFKHLLSDRRQGFKFESIKKMLVISCNQTD